METYRLAESEAAFWAADPQAMAEAHGERCAEYLQRVMLHGAPLAPAQDVAWSLASYVRDARARIEQADLPALEAVRASGRSGHRPLSETPGRARDRPL